MPKSNRPKSTSRLIIAVGVIAVIIVVVALILLSQSRVQPLGAVRLASDPSLGLPSAKVTIIEYGDFGCTTCRGWEQAGVLKQIVAAYGNQVHFVWRDDPILRPMPQLRRRVNAHSTRTSSGDIVICYMPKRLP